MRARLIALRKEKGLTQQQVADMLGITRSFYGMIETGDRNPTLDLAKRIAEIFGTGIEDLFFTSDSNTTLLYCQPTGTDGS
ncbi:MAG: helix-turn-helix transcriptional regulator [Moorellaceae bacterium]